jgi:uncharacterized protein (UPF0333 family)
MGSVRRAGQASAEYLILIAVVIIVVSFATWLYRDSILPSDDMRSGQSRVYWNNEKPIAIMDAKAIKGGLILLLKNTGTQTLAISRISVREQSMNAGNSTSLLLPIDPGMLAKITVPASYPSGLKGKFVFLDMRFDYVIGLSKSLSGKDLLVIPAPSSCNQPLELCYSDLDCCNQVKCKYSLCGGCGNEWLPCNYTSDCCFGLQCYQNASGAKLCRGKPDLVPLQRSGEFIDPDSHISLRIMNLGAGPAYPSTAKLRWQVRGCAEGPLCDREEPISVPELEGGMPFDFESSTICRNMTNMTLEADFGDIINESNEANNLLNVTAYCPMPDLVCSINSSSPQVAGSQFPITIRTSNLGDAESASGAVTRARFGGGTINGSSQLDIQLGLLPPGSASTDGALARCTNTGLFGLNATADVNYLIGELFETNNFCNTTVMCIGPDMVASASEPMLSGEHMLYAPFNVTINTSNIGDANADNYSKTLVRFGIQQTIVANLTVPPLMNHTSAPLVNVTMNCTSLGLVPFNVTADAYGNVSEYAQESNNFWSYSVNCVDPRISVSPTIWYTNTSIGSTTSQVFTITNTGTGTLNVNSMSLEFPVGQTPNQFAITSSFTGPIAQSGTATFTVRFQPTTAGAKAARVRIISNDRLNPSMTVPLVGNLGYPPFTYNCVKTPNQYGPWWGWANAPNPPGWRDMTARWLGPATNCEWISDYYILYNSFVIPQNDTQVRIEGIGDDKSSVWIWPNKNPSNEIEVWFDKFWQAGTGPNGNPWAGGKNERSRILDAGVYTMAIAVDDTQDVVTAIMVSMANNVTGSIILNTHPDMQWCHVRTPSWDYANRTNNVCAFAYGS